MKDFFELKNSEKGKDIYVLGSGKTLDYIPKSFFQGKVVVGSGDLYRYIPCKYYVRKEYGGYPKALELSRDVHSRAGVPDPIWILSRHDCGNHSGRVNYFPGTGAYWFKHISNDTQTHVEELETDRIIVSWSTINSAIHCAYVLGAANIILAGADCGTIDGETNVSGYWVQGESFGIPDPQWYKNWLGQISKATEDLANAIRAKGVSVTYINPFVNFRLEGHKYESG